MKLQGPALDAEGLMNDMLWQSEVWKAALATVILLCSQLAALNATASTGVTNMQYVERSLKSYIIAEASILHESIQSAPRSIETRQKISMLYFEHNGLDALSKFYLVTSRFLSEKELSIPKSTSWSNAIACDLFDEPYEEAKEEAIGGRLAAKNLAALARQETSADLIKLSYEAISKHGTQCTIMAEWSKNILLVEEYTTNDQEEELAIRFLITLAEEDIFPEDYPNRAAVYILVSEWFYTSGDIISSYVAALYAQDRAQDCDVENDPYCEYFKTASKHWIERLEEKLEVND